MLGGRIGVAAQADGAIPSVTVAQIRWTQAASYRSRQYTYNNVDQITSISEQTEAGTRTGTPDYDGNGNQTHLTWSDGTAQDNGFDPWNRLTSQTINGQTMGMTYIPGGVERLSRGNVTYRRDGQGLLGMTKDGADTTYGLYGGMQLYESTGGTVTSLVVDPDRTVRGRVGSFGGSAPMFLSRLFTDPTGEASGQIFAQAQQQPNGSTSFMGPTSESTIATGFEWKDGAIIDGLGWHGLMYDAAAKQIQNGARVLDTASGTFLSADAHGYAGSPALYAFPWDPIGMDDKTGNDWEYVADEAGVIPGILWDSTTSGHWRYISGTDPRVPKPGDDITPGMMGLAGNQFGQDDYDRGVAGGAGAFNAWWSNFETAPAAGGSIAYGGAGNRASLVVPPLNVVSTTMNALGHLRMGMASTVLNGARDLTPVFVFDRGSALIAGQSPYRAADEQLSRSDAAKEIAMVIATGGAMHYGMRSIDASAGRIAGFGSSNRPMASSGQLTGGISVTQR